MNRITGVSLWQSHVVFHWGCLMLSNDNRWKSREGVIFMFDKWMSRLSDCHDLKDLKRLHWKRGSDEAPCGL